MRLGLEAAPIRMTRRDQSRANRAHRAISLARRLVPVAFGPPMTRATSHNCREPGTSSRKTPANNPGRRQSHSRRCPKSSRSQAPPGNALFLRLCLNIPARLGSLCPDGRSPRPPGARARAVSAVGLAAESGKHWAQCWRGALVAGHDDEAEPRGQCGPRQSLGPRGLNSTQKRPPHAPGKRNDSPPNWRRRRSICGQTRSWLASLPANVHTSTFMSSLPRGTIFSRPRSNQPEGDCLGSRLGSLVSCLRRVDCDRIRPALEY